MVLPLEERKWRAICGRVLGRISRNAPSVYLVVEEGDVTPDQ